MSIAIINAIELSAPRPDGRRRAKLTLQMIGMDNPFIAHGSVSRADNYIVGSVVDIDGSVSYGEYRFGPNIRLVPPDLAKDALADAEMALDEARKASAARDIRDRKERLERAQSHIARNIESADFSIDATIQSISFRDDDYIGARINAGGYTFIKGGLYPAFKIEKGSKVRLTGKRDGSQIKFAPNQLLLLDRPYCDDPVERVARRACKSINRKRLDYLERELGADWLTLIRNDPWDKNVKTRRSP
jgi:hypothetical protein